MNLCAKIGCSTLNDMGGVCGQRNKPTHRETEIWCITVRLRLLEVCLTTKWIWSGLLSPRMVPQHERTKQIKAGGGGINSRKDKKKGKRNRKDKVGEKKRALHRHLLQKSIELSANLWQPAQPALTGSVMHPAVSLGLVSLPLRNHQQSVGYESLTANGRMPSQLQPLNRTQSALFPSEIKYKKIRRSGFYLGFAHTGTQQQQQLTLSEPWWLNNQGCLDGARHKD